MEIQHDKICGTQTTGVMTQIYSNKIHTLEKNKSLINNIKSYLKN